MQNVIFEYTSVTQQLSSRYFQLFLQNVSRLFLQNVRFFPMKELFKLDLLKFQFGIMCGIAAQEPDGRPPGAVCALHFLGWLGTALMDVSEDARRVGRDQVRNVSQHGLPAAIHLGSGRRIGL